MSTPLRKPSWFSMKWRQLSWESWGTLWLENAKSVRKCENDEIYTVMPFKIKANTFKTNYNIKPNNINLFLYQDFILYFRTRSSMFLSKAVIPLVYMSALQYSPEKPERPHRYVLFGPEGRGGMSSDSLV